MTIPLFFYKAQTTQHIFFVLVTASHTCTYNICSSFTSYCQSTFHPLSSLPLIISSSLTHHYFIPFPFKYIIKIHLGSETHCYLSCQLYKELHVQYLRKYLIIGHRHILYIYIYFFLLVLFA